MFVRQRRLADAIAGGAVGEPGDAHEVVPLDVRSREPALHSTSARCGLPAMAGGVSAVVAQSEVRARHRVARRIVPRECRSLGGTFKTVGSPVRLRATWLADRL